MMQALTAEVHDHRLTLEKWAAQDAAQRQDIEALHYQLNKKVNENKQLKAERKADQVRIEQLQIETRMLKVTSIAACTQAASCLRMMRTNLLGCLREGFHTDKFFSEGLSELTVDCCAAKVQAAGTWKP